MKFTILLLVFCAGVSCQENAEPQEANRRMSTSYTTSIIHGEGKDGHGVAQSSVKVNFHSPHDLPNQLLSKPSVDTTATYSQKPEASYVQNYGYPYQAEASSHSETYQIKPVSAQETTYQYQVVQPAQDNQIPGTETYMQYNTVPAQAPIQHVQIQDAPGYGNPQHYQRVLGQYQTTNIQPDTRMYAAYQQQPEQLPQALPLQAPATQAVQEAQPNSNSPTFLQYTAPKPIDPYTTSKDQQQLYNVGYSINIENVTPKLMYRVPQPPPLHRFRQQKLLNADVITGTHKETVQKPAGLSQSINNLENTQINAVPSNYLQDHNAAQLLTYNDNEKQQLTRVYADVRNTHGYTWKNLSPGVEISGYHNLNEPMAVQQQAQHFDHAAALGRSQGFDISNVVEGGNSHVSSVRTPKTAPVQTSHYQQPGVSAFSAPTYNALNLQPSYKPSTNRQSHNLKLPKSTGSNLAHFGTSSNAIKIEPLVQTPNKDLFKFQESDIELLNIPSLKHNFGIGTNIEFDKSLLEGFYKSYNPSFFATELSLPSTIVPQSITLDTTQNSFQKFNHKPVHIPIQNSHYQPIAQALDPQLMVNQHYAFVQAEGASTPPNKAVQFTDVKPVKEAQREQQGQQSKRHEVTQKPDKHNMHKNTEHTKSNGNKKPRASSPPAYRTRTNLMNDKDYHLQRKLRPPPMIIIHQKY